MWVIKFQSHPCRTVVTLLNLELGEKKVLFPKGISPKVSIIEWVELEFVYYNVVVQLVSHNVTGSPPLQVVMTLWGIAYVTLVALVLDIWLHILIILYFTPTLVSRCNALSKGVPKRIIQKEKTGQIRDEDVSFILSFIYWVQQPFHGWGCFSWIHWNGWIPQLRCQKYVNSFSVCRCPHLVSRASIRVNFLLEILSKSSNG